MKYFVSYAYFLQNGGSGFGNIEADRSWPISSSQDITELTAHITDSVSRAMRGKQLTLTILSWQQFEPDIERKRVDGSSRSNIVTLHPTP